MDTVLENSDTLLGKLASEIKSRRLEAPVVFFLEMHKPLFGLLQSATTISAPILSALIGPQKLERVEELMQDRKNVEKLIRLLEEKE